MKLRLKILSGFLLIIAMLLVAGLMSIYEFSRIGRSVSALIEENYKTIEACRTMLEALEREDSGILLLVSGQWKEGRNILESADSLFESAYDVALNNITETDEDKYIESVDIAYKAFKEKWEPPIVGTVKENSVDWYFKELHPNFNLAKSEIKALMTLNEDNMYSESRVLKEQAHRAIMPGIVAIIVSLLFLVMFNFFISIYYVQPIYNLITAIKKQQGSNQKFSAGISTNDELKKLENEIQNLIIRLKES